jgi:putative FmdB family regulatory protein
MPTYEYECKKCSHGFEVFQSMSDNPITICPECGGEVRRIINGGGGIIFKGSGFYSTDKGSGSAPPVTKKSAPACAACPHSEGGKSPCAQKAAG